MNGMRCRWEAFRTYNRKLEQRYRCHHRYLQKHFHKSREDLHALSENKSYVTPTLHIQSDWLIRYRENRQKSSSVIWMIILIGQPSKLMIGNFFLLKKTTWLWVLSFSFQQYVYIMCMFKERKFVSLVATNGFQLNIKVIWKKAYCRHYQSFTTQCTEVTNYESSGKTSHNICFHNYVQCMVSDLG